MGHQDFAHELDGGIRLQFFWAPYPANLTAVLGRLAAAQAQAVGSRRLLDEQQSAAEQQQAAVQQAGKAGEPSVGQQQGEAAVAVGSSNVPAQGQPQQQQQQQQQEAAGAQAGTNPQQQAQRPRQRPALVTLSGTLWHLLHMTAPDAFEAELKNLGQVAAAFAGQSASGAAGSSSSGGSSPRLVLASGTEMFPNRMRTVQKQHSMTPQNLDAYNRAMQQVSRGAYSLACSAALSLAGLHGWAWCVGLRSFARSWPCCAAVICLRLLSMLCPLPAQPLQPIHPTALHHPSAAGGPAVAGWPVFAAGPVPAYSALRRGVQHGWRAQRASGVRCRPAAAAQPCGSTHRAGRRPQQQRQPS